MPNFLTRIGVGLADLGKWVKDAVVGVVGLADKVKKVLAAEKPLEKPFVDGVGLVVADIEALIAAAAPAVQAAGINFAEDTAAYNAFVKLMNDFKEFAPVAEAALKALGAK